MSTTPNKKRKMKHTEELELPPWEKFNKYGIFPTKLVIHILLLIILTVEAILSNADFSNYSRSVSNSIDNLFLPPDYTDYQTSLCSDKQYYCFTQQQTIDDSNRLISSYYSLPINAVSKFQIYTPLQDSVPAPYVEVTTTSGIKSYDLSNGTDSEWPLSLNSPILQNQADLTQFFYNLLEMKFYFDVRSFGYSEGLEFDKEMCYRWQLNFIYDLQSAGQILVTSSTDVIERCEMVDQSSFLFIGGFIIVILSIIYLLLLIKAVNRHFIILSIIRKVSKLSMPAVIAQAEARAAKEIHESNYKNSKEEKEYNKSKYASKGKYKNNNKKESISIFSKWFGFSDANKNNNQDNDDSNHKLLREYDNSSNDDQITKLEIQKNISSANSLNVIDNDKHKVADVGELSEELAKIREAFQNLSLKDKLSIINLWFIVSLTGAIFSTAYGIVAVFDLNGELGTRTVNKSFLGGACLFTWFSLIQYLEYFPEYYVLISMLKKSAPRISQFLMGVFPLFIGYALLAMVSFGDNVDRFGDLLETLTTLFSVVNGDIIYETFSSLSDFGIAGQLFIYIYVIIFTYIVLMTIIAIVEEAFFESKLLSRSFAKKNGDYDEDDDSEYNDNFDKQRNLSRSSDHKPYKSYSFNQRTQSNNTEQNSDSRRSSFKTGDNIDNHSIGSRKFSFKTGEGIESNVRRTSFNTRKIHVHDNIKIILRGREKIREQLRNQSDDLILENEATREIDSTNDNSIDVSNSSKKSSFLNIFGYGVKSPTNIDIDNNVSSMASKISSSVHSIKSSEGMKLYLESMIQELNDKVSTDKESNKKLKEKEINDIDLFEKD